MFEIAGAAFGPDETSGKIWRVVFWLATAAIVLGGLCFTIESGAFDTK